MKRQIRQGVFETNSSSTHAICISKKNVTKEDILTFIKFNHGEFGWEFDKYDSISDRASYLYQAICELCWYNNKVDYNAVFVYIKSLCFTLSKYGVDCEFDLNHKDSEGFDIGYIDHGDRTREFVASVMHSEERLLRYLFGDSVIITGNDNDDDFEEYMATHDLGSYEVFFKGN